MQFSERTRAELRNQIRAAWARRGILHEDPTTDAYRIFHGFTEGCPGLNIERFADCAVIFLHDADLEPRLGVVLDSLDELFAPRLTILKERHLEGRRANGRVLRGALLEEPFEVRERGLRFAIDPLRTPNMGLFLDARPARAWIRAHAKGLRVLNLFAYTGSLGIAAAVGGAKGVTHVDTQERSLRRAQGNHTLNGLPIDHRDLLAGDVYFHLPRAVRSGRSFGGIILDPPPKVPERGRHKTDGQDWAKLASLCGPLLMPEGWLLCFLHRASGSWSDREAEICEAAGVPLEVIWRGTSGEDFPERDLESKLRLSAFRRGVVA